MKYEKSVKILRSKKFIKIVSWDKKPFGIDIAMGIIAFILALGIICFSSGINNFNEGWTYFAGICLFGASFRWFLDGLGKGREVFWKKIKEKRK